MKKLCIIITILLATHIAINSQEIEHKLLVELDFGNSLQYGFGIAESSFFVIDKNKTLRVFSLETLKEIHKNSGKAEQAFYSPDGKWLAIPTQKEINILNIKTGISYSNSYKNKVRFLSWSSDSKRFAIADDKFEVRIINAETATEKAKVTVHKRKKLFFSRVFDSGQFSSVEAFFIPNSNKIFTICGDKTGELWDTETGNLLQTFRHFDTSAPYKEREIIGGAVSSDGKWIITRTYDENHLWDAEDGKLVKSFVGYGYLQFSPDSKYLGLINDPNGDRAVRIMDLKTQNIRKLFDKYQGGLTRWSEDGKSFITDRTIDEVSKETAYLWDTETGKQKAEFKTYSKYCFDLVSTCRSDFDKFVFSPNGKILLSHNKKETKFINAENGELLKTLEDMGSPLIWNKQGNYILAKKPKQDKIGLWQVSVDTD